MDRVEMSRNASLVSHGRQENYGQKIEFCRSVL